MPPGPVRAPTSRSASAVPACTNGCSRPNAAGAIIGQSGGETGTDNDFIERGFEGIGATLMGRNMFGPVRGPWGDSDWKGWWGDEPPYHHPVIVLTHHARPPLEMDGGTTFHFVDTTVEAAVEQAFAAAGGSTCASAAAPHWSAPVSGPVWSTSFMWRWCRCCSDRASACSATSTVSTATNASSSSVGSRRARRAGPLVNDAPARYW